VVRARLAVSPRLSLRASAASCLVDVGLGIVCLAAFLIAGLALAAVTIADPRIDRLALEIAGAGLTAAVLLALAERWGGDYTGVTLSARQAAVATDAIHARGRDGHVRVLVRSYDDPPDGPFDVIVAIESLIHSSDPARSLSALSHVLAPGGSLVLVDDMPEAQACDMPELAIFKSGWGCGALWTREQYGDALESLRLRIVTDLDLSADCRPRSGSRIRVMTWLNLMAARIAPSQALRAVMVSHRGGLALEQLLRSGRMRYRLLVASSSSSVCAPSRLIPHG
jgi:SAM-dependent methyltransferase